MMAWFESASFDLRVLLIACGALVVVAVGVFSWWAARSTRANEPRREPELHSLRSGPDAANDSPEEPAATDGTEAAAPDAAREAAGHEPSVSEPRPYPKSVSNVLDYVVVLGASDTLSRAQALGIVAALRPVPVMPVRVYGWNAGDAGGWQELSETGAADDGFTELVFAMQLASKEQVAAAADLASLYEAVSSAAGVDGRVTANYQQQRAVEYCAALTALVRHVDPIVTLNIIATGERSFSGARIRQVTAEFGLELGRMNIFHKTATVGGGQATLFSMANLFDPGSFEVDKLDATHTRGLLLFMNVPLTPNPAGVFNTMSVVAKGMCRRLEGRLTGHDREPLHEEQVDQVRCAILETCGRMQRSGVTPGSAEAHRLFG